MLSTYLRCDVKPQYVLPKSIDACVGRPSAVAAAGAASGVATVTAQQPQGISHWSVFSIDE